LNALLARLRDSFDTQRAFVADAAHELRSPLTALKLQLRLLQNAGDEAARSAALAAVAAGIDRATRLIEQLLTLARSEPGAAPAALEPVAIARQAVAETLPFAPTRSVEFELLATGPAFVSGDALALGLLVRNLADNAARYSPPGCRVEVSVSGTATEVLLQVDDSGPGIAENERDRVFDRFYRRADNRESGSGLGLAIVRSVVLAHGASIALESAPLGGLRVSVRFRPRLEPPGQRRSLAVGAAS
jgi:two-component system OmpR family sensor kinase/two-component system sensor histidine kinase QseC